MKSKNKFIDDDLKYVWHPFTPMDEWESEDPPLIIKEGKGSYLIDIDGKKYLDGISSLWVNLHGHKKNEIDASIKNQLKKVAHSTQLGMGNTISIELAKKLISIAPKGLSRVFFSDSGSTSVEAAMKIAFQYQLQRPDPKPEKSNFLTLNLGYHGDTIGAVSLGGIEAFHFKFSPLLFPTIRVETPYCYWCPRGSSEPPCSVCSGEEIVTHISNNADRIAGVVIEPLIQGASGMITQKKGFLKKIKDACIQHDVLLIADEVATGFGRTGKMFACEHEKVCPDIICLAKGLSGGYLPIAATITTEKIFNAFRGEYKEGKMFAHGHSYTANPLACAAALANLEIFKKEKTIDKIQPKIRTLWEEVRNLEKLDFVGDVRGLGLMIGIELMRNKLKKIPFQVEERVARKITLKVREKGLIIRPLGDVIVFMPPYSITKKEIKWAIKTIGTAIEEISVI
ncbi:MAG: adenosylmethionine--8-amino-7-oxononanoate transaminase [Nitrospinota bacterium]|nr:adenosylmethionine--8-amino-7-oxononanoate transaminase [Nitrospinota bacterium]